MHRLQPVHLALGDRRPAVGCTQNATAGEEYRRGWHPEKFHPATKRRRACSSWGPAPAGMECAMVLAKRGFRRIHLIDSKREPGGALAWASSLPGLGEWRRAINWRAIQIAQLRNVELILGAEQSAQQVREYGAEIVILATGAQWATDGLSAVTHAPIPELTLGSTGCSHRSR